MTYSEAHKRANLKYAKNNLKRVEVIFRAESDGLTYDKVKEAAALAGETPNAYMKNAIMQRIKGEQDGQ